jgi:hypothetical protein
MVTYESLFAIQDKVYIDGDQSLVVTVTAVVWRNEKPSIEVSWISDQAKTAWIEPWRLTEFKGYE